MQPFDPELFSDYLLSDQTPHPAVARIIAPESTGVSLGSGVLVDVNGSQGLVLTNWHVIRDSRSAVLVQFADGFQSAGTVIRFDEAWDLAAISICSGRPVAGSSLQFGSRRRPQCSWPNETQFPENRFPSLDMGGEPTVNNGGVVQNIYRPVLDIRRSSSSCRHRRDKAILVVRF